MRAFAQQPRIGKRAMWAAAAKNKEKTPAPVLLCDARPIVLMDEIKKKKEKKTRRYVIFPCYDTCLFVGRCDYTRAPGEWSLRNSLYCERDIYFLSGMRAGGSLLRK